ncbi:MAG: DsrE family protein [Pseudomonadota bacterium]|nr:DsrE family protein [Pseudomonadota bacterium]
MTQPSRRRFAALAGGTALAAALASESRAQSTTAPLKIVFQVSDGEVAKWNLALNNVRNVQTELPDDTPEIEVVAYGPGIGMLKSDSPIAARVAETLKNGVKVVACENTMKNMKLNYADMLPNIGYVPAGVVEIAQKQRQGFAYIKP